MGGAQCSRKRSSSKRTLSREPQSAQYFGVPISSIVRTAQADTVRNKGREGAVTRSPYGPRNGPVDDPTRAGRPWNLNPCTGLDDNYFDCCRFTATIERIRVSLPARRG